jgi:hypothetical protein
LHEQFIEIPRSAFASLISRLSGGRPREDDPGPYEPSEALVRALIEAIHRRPRPNWEPSVTLRVPAVLVEALRYGPRPEPWIMSELNASRPNWESFATLRVPAVLFELLGYGPHPEPWVTIGLNPQPLPPVADALAVAGELASKVILVTELANMLPDEEAVRARDFAARQLSQFVRDAIDDRCPLWWYLRPFPRPRPPRWPWGGLRGDDLTGGITPFELIVMGAQLESVAPTTSSDALRESLSAAGQELMNLGLRRLEVPAPEAVVA